MSGALLAASVTTIPHIVLDPTYMITDLDLLSASASIIFQTTGAIENQHAAQIGTWIDPMSAAPSDYEIRATPNPDTPDVGNMNTWQALTSQRAWTENYAGGPGAETAVFDIEIRKGSTIQDSTTVTLNAQIIG